jgi:hypothetical protein
MAKVPAGGAVAFSNGMECPGCKAQLEVSAGSRMLATTVGLLAGALVWRMARTSGGMLDWVLPMVYAFLAFCGVAAAWLMATADLRVRPAEPAAEPATSAAGHAHRGAHH